MADAILTLTVREANITRVLDSFTAVSDTDMVIACRGSQDEPDGSDFAGQIHLRIEPQDVSETAKQFATRVLRSLGKAIVMLYETKLDQDRYADDVAAIDPVVITVPDDIIE